VNFHQYSRAAGETTGHRLLLLLLLLLFASFACSSL
jgi:hypothetical protein